METKVVDIKGVLVVMPDGTRKRINTSFIAPEESIETLREFAIIVSGGSQVFFNFEQIWLQNCHER